MGLFFSFSGIGGSHLVTPTPFSRTGLFSLLFSKARNKRATNRADTTKQESPHSLRLTGTSISTDRKWGRRPQSIRRSGQSDSAAGLQVLDGRRTVAISTASGLEFFVAVADKKEKEMKKKGKSENEYRQWSMTNRVPPMGVKNRGRTFGCSADVPMPKPTAESPVTRPRDVLERYELVRVDGRHP